MKVLVCDSGISKTQENKINYCDIGQGVWDEAQHGSTVCDIIKLLSPKSEVESIKILDKDNSATLGILLEALEYCAISDCQVICLALSVDYNQECVPLKKCIDAIISKGKIIVSSNRNRYKFSYPACYECVIGCQIQQEEIKETLYSANRTIQSALPLNAVLRKIETDGFNILGGNSLSCAVMAGEISNIMESNNIIAKEDLDIYLEKLKWEEYQIYKLIPQTKNISENDNLKRISDTIYDIFTSNDFDMDEPLYMSSNLKMLLEILSNIGYLDNINNCITQMNDLYNIKTLSEYIYTINSKY